jgi:predicted enzyme related to lactoylglutathione lyase
MPLMDRYAPGTFCWADLGTPDAPAATRFYSALFGWTAEDRPMGPEAFYTMFQLDGRPVAALYPQEPAHQGPPHWLSYLTVSSANDSAARAASLGGTVLMEPFDVLDVGRMAMLQDPTGAVVALWEPRRHAGAGVVREASAMCWNELGTTDTRRAGEFYASLVGWSAESRSMGAYSYTTFSADGETRGGMMTIAPSLGRVPPHWLVYFAVRDCEGTAALCQSLGGAVRVPPSDVPDVGRFAVLADPQGAVFAVLARATAGDLGSG